ncbi:uncharacterized protein LOC124361840 [Homalodisca vitripennis]|uniref:uncharacterized protein LOC124361840 n=1 Tax=Homalodisca vitripennis TaxID=197043 RepID=UPI001EEA9921|nr:uncharacterized protein LOC124361840 [Homalodisca vitripennis]
MNRRDPCPRAHAPSRIPAPTYRRQQQQFGSPPSGPNQRVHLAIEETIRGPLRPGTRGGQRRQPQQTCPNESRRRRHTGADLPCLRRPPPGGDQTRTGTGWAAQLPHLQLPRSCGRQQGVYRDPQHRNEFQQSQGSAQQGGLRRCPAYHDEFRRSHSEVSFPRQRPPPCGADQMRTSTGWASQIPRLQTYRGEPRPTGVHRCPSHRNEFGRSQSEISFQRRRSPPSGADQMRTSRGWAQQLPHLHTSREGSGPSRHRHCPSYRNEFAQSQAHLGRPSSGVRQCPSYRNEFGRSQSEISVPRLRGPSPSGNQMRTGVGWATQLPDIQVTRPTPTPEGVRRDPGYRNEFRHTDIFPTQSGNRRETAARALEQIQSIMCDARQRVNEVAQNVLQRRQ